MTQVLWSYVDDAREALLWEPLPAPETVSQEEMDQLLHREHWVMVSRQLDPNLFLILSGQLLRTRSLDYEDFPLLSPIARERDIAQGHAVPVALAFPVPEQVKAFLDRNNGGPLIASHFFPPDTFGQVGVVFSDGARWSYPLQMLEAEADQIQSELAAMLRQLSERDYMGDSAACHHAQVLAFRLACWYRDYHQRTHPILTAAVRSHASLAGLPTESLATPPLFQAGRPALVPVPLPTRAVVAATSAGRHRRDKWIVNAEGIPVFTYHDVEGTARVEIRPKGLTTQIDERIQAALLTIVQDLSPLEGAVFLVLLGFSLAAPADETGNHLVYVEQVLQARGIQQKEKDGLYHPEDKLRVAIAIDHLNSFWVQLEQVLQTMLYPPPLTQELWTHYSKLLQIEGVIRRKRVAGILPQEEYLAGDVSLASGEGQLVAWHFHFGTWLRPFLQEPHRQVARLDQRALSYHVNNEFWEGLLLQYVTFLRARTPGQNPLHFRVGNLLTEQSLPINERHPQKTLDRFDLAWKRLVAEGQIAQVQRHYDASKFNTHRWLNQWFNSYLSVYLPHTEE